MGSTRHELARWLSKAGLCSRTDAADWVREGRVRVDGLVVRDPTLAVHLSRSRIEVDGRALSNPELGPQHRRVLMLHKPRGYVTTWRDPDGSPTVYDLLQGVDQWLAPVGRLDKDTSGLLLFTNDPAFAAALTDPKTHVPKTYRVEATPRVDRAKQAELARGVQLDDGPTRPAKVQHVKDRGPATVLDLTLTEGRNRQVRRMLRAVGSKVSKLSRVALGGLVLGELERGTWRWLEPREIDGLVPPRAGPGAQPPGPA